MINKAVIFFVAVMMTSFTASASSSNEMHVGAIESADLLNGYQEFSESYADFSVKEQNVALLKSITTPVEVVVLFGTWCHDSQREVPRFIKLLEQADLGEMIKVRYVAVNYDKEDDLSLSKTHNLKYTPTFVVLKSGIEIGRIVERPIDSLAQDLSKIISAAN